SNANLTLPLPFITGGSWKKSPVTTTWEKCVRTWMAPNGSGLFRISDPMRASLSKRSPSTMETMAL
ncbi:hypothetical protein BC628DRAFT_1301645, partial [Trametes gibbosa]